MLKQNMGRLDRTIRFIAAVGLTPIALFALGGWRGDLGGIVVGAVALLMLVTAVTGFCPGYVPFGISTGGGERSRNAARTAEGRAPVAGRREGIGDPCPCAELPELMVVPCGPPDGEEEPLAATGRKG